MRRTLVLVSLALLLIASRAGAEPISYTFTGLGAETLTGAFTLNSSTWLTTTVGENTLGVLSSPTNLLSGSYGAYTFTGVPSLYVFDEPEFYSDGRDASGPDSWIVRTPLTGPLVNGIAPTFLNLFIYTSPAALTGTSLTPPAHNVNPFDFQFTLSFADASGGSQSFVNGSLQSLTRVPEPATLLLLSVGGAFVLSVRRRRS